MAPKEDEQERREVVRRLENEKLRLNRQKAQIDPSPTKIDRQLVETEAKILRAQSAANDPSFGTEVCFECWVEIGERVPLTPQPSGYAEDIYRCRNGHECRVRFR